MVCVLTIDRVDYLSRSKGKEMNREPADETLIAAMIAVLIIIAVARGTSFIHELLEYFK